MYNQDNKTKLVEGIKLNKYKKLIENNPCQIATVTSSHTPNLSVASDIKVIDDVTIIISNNEMINTPDNIIDNGLIVITSFNKEWAGVRLTGCAEYHTDGEYFNLCNEYFKNENTTPKGVFVVTIKKVEALA